MIVFLVGDTCLTQPSRPAEVERYDGVAGLAANIRVCAFCKR